LLCKATFARVKKDKTTYSWFHSITELFESAAEVYYLYNLLLDDTITRGRPEGDVVEFMKAKDGQSAYV